MNHVVTTGVVLARLNYGEADKIITVLTPDHGKIRVMARGVRRVKSKLAGGIELFSVSSVTYIPGKKDISTLVSTRLQTHYSFIVEDLDRTMLGYDLLKYINKATQDECDSDYYVLLVTALANLNDKTIDPILTKSWFMAQLLELLGHAPNVKTDTAGESLSPKKAYQFDYQEMGFRVVPNGTIGPNHIKLLRLLFTEKPERLRVISGVRGELAQIELLLRQALQDYII